MFASTKADVESAIITQLKNTEGVDLSKISENATFEDIGVDNSARKKLYSNLEEKYNISLSSEDINSIKGVQELTKIIMNKLSNL